MSSPGVQANPQSSLPFGEEAKPGLRTKTAATRLTPDELRRNRSCRRKRWTGSLRVAAGTALCAARQRPPDPSELVLAELWAVRYALLNLFHAAAEAAAEGRQLLPDFVLKIRDQADAENSIMLVNFSKNSLPARTRKELVCHECNAFSQNPLALDAVALGSRHVLSATGSAERVAKPVFK